MTTTDDPTFRHAALDELAKLVAADPRSQFDRGQLEYMSAHASAEPIRRAAQTLLTGFEPAPGREPDEPDPFAGSGRYPVDLQRTLTPGEVAWLAAAANRPDELTLDDAVDVAYLAARSDDDGTARLADLATRAHRAEVADQIAKRRRSADAKILAAMPTGAPRLHSADRANLVRQVGELIAPDIDAPDADIRGRVAAEVVSDTATKAEAARDAAYADRRTELGGAA